MPMKLFIIPCMPLMAFTRNIIFFFFFWEQSFNRQGFSLFQILAIFISIIHIPTKQNYTQLNHSDQFKKHTLNAYNMTWSVMNLDVWLWVFPEIMKWEAAEWIPLQYGAGKEVWRGHHGWHDEALKWGLLDKWEAIRQRWECVCHLFSYKGFYFWK